MAASRRWPSPPSTCRASERAARGCAVSLANQACAGSDCSSHCSRSLASYARTSFQSLFAFLASAQAAFPAQRRGVTNTNVVSARSFLSSAFTLLSKSPSAFALGSSLVPNSQPERPAGIQGVPPLASTNPSQPGRSASSLPGKSTFVSPLPVECINVRKKTAKRLRAGMLCETHSSMSLALIAKNGGTYAFVSAGASLSLACAASYWACIFIRSLSGHLNALSRRAAMSADRAAFPLSRFERAGRPTPMSWAALVTDIPGGMTSALIRAPGCGTSAGADIE